MISILDQMSLLQKWETNVEIWQNSNLKQSVNKVTIISIEDSEVKLGDIGRHAYGIRSRYA